MKSSVQILPGIKKIGWLYCSRLPERVDLAALAGLKVALLTDLNDITFFGTPDCRCSMDKENNGFFQTASLKFKSCESLPATEKIAFVVTDVNDSSFLIGSAEMPMPAVRVERVTGETTGDPAGFLYDVTHKALRSMIPCLV